MQGVFLDVGAKLDKAWHSSIIAKSERVKKKKIYLKFFQILPSKQSANYGNC